MNARSSNTTILISAEVDRFAELIIDLPPLRRGEKGFAAGPDTADVEGAAAAADDDDCPTLRRCMMVVVLELFGNKKVHGCFCSILVIAILAIFHDDLVFAKTIEVVQYSNLN